MKTQIFTPEQLLLLTMLTAASASGALNEQKTAYIADILAHLPALQNLPKDALPRLLPEFAELLSAEEGLAALLDMLAEGLPPALHETAYALATELIAQKPQCAPEDMRFLELLRTTLGLEKLVATAIERGIRARFHSA